MTNHTNNSAGYWVSKIYLRNFKVVAEKEINSIDLNFVVFDGPNGFGKTTLFDAIELCLTGQVYRLKNNPTEGRRAVGTNVFQKIGTTEPFVVRLQLTNGESAINLAVTWNQNTKGKGLQGHKFEESLYPRFLLDNFDDPLEDERNTSQAQIENALGFGSFSLRENFSWLFYVQQDEAVAFLKQVENKRAKVLNQLFHTSDEDNLRSRFEVLRNQVQVKIDVAVSSLNEAKQSVNEIQQRMIDFERTDVEYESIFVGLEVEVEWDKERIRNLDQSKREKLLRDVGLFREIMTNPDDLKIYLFNLNLNKYAANSSLLVKFLLLKGDVGNYSDLEKQYGDLEKAEKLLSKLRFETQSELSKEDLDLFTKITGIALEQDLVERILTDAQNIGILRRSSSQIGKLAKSLNDSREKLWKGFEVLLEEIPEDSENEFSKNTCPLCGDIKADRDALIKDLDKHREEIAKLYDDSTSNVEKAIENQRQVLESSVVGQLEGTIGELKKTISKAFFDKIKSNKNQLRELSEFITWLSATQISAVDFLVSDLTEFADLDEKLKGFREQLENAEKEYEAEESVLREFYTSYFMALFRGNFEVISKLSEMPSLDAKLDNKVQYINQLYFADQEEKIEKLSKDISANKTTIDRLAQFQRKVSRIIEIYQSAIRQFWMDAMHSIEIPFYIYSGKILQDHQRGSGIFIVKSQDDTGKAVGKTDSVKFVFHNQTDHDALHTFSSGQLAALSISFMLSLNRVFGDSALGFILIDDPIQSMDDINMISLVDLLRNDFADRQIIVSTHEDEFSAYARYKFKKSGFKIGRIDARKEFFYSSK